MDNASDRPTWDVRDAEDLEGFTTSPWRRVGDYVEAAPPLTGTTRYRVLERTERRHRWHERRAPHYEVVGTEYDREARPHSVVMWNAGLERELDDPDVYEVTVPALPEAGHVSRDELAVLDLLEGAPSKAAALAAGEDVRGWHVAWNEPTGFPPGRPPVVVTDELAEAFVELIGTVGYVQALTMPGGRRTEAQRAERLELGRRVAAVLHDGRQRGTATALARFYGRHRDTFYELAKLGGFTPTQTLRGEESRPRRELEFHSDTNPQG